MELKNILPIFLFFLVGLRVVFAPCGETGFFTPKSKYDANRRLLLSSLASNVSAQGGFYNASVGEKSDRVYALGMCRQGADPKVCSNCIDLASKELIEKCPNQTEGLAWPENVILCMVRYSNRSFFGSLELEPSYILYNTGAIRSNLAEFNKLWEDLTRRMIDGATSSSSEGKYYAAEKVPLTPIQNVYALMQCNPILSLRDCNICLNQSVRDYEGCCNGYQGGIFYRLSCVFRWEVYAFSQAFDLTLAPPPRLPTSLPPSVGNKTNTTKRGSESISAGIVVAIVVPTVIFFLVLFAIAISVCRRRKSDRAIVGQGSSIDITAINTIQFGFKTIEAATDQFSERNVIGQGGFGEVFKAVLAGTEVAIKRLSKASGQGDTEFKNEVVVVAKLQHRNLVRLLGFSIEGEERILVYEYVPNKSLDYFLSDPEKQGQLDGTGRYNIIGGIARGILYLHQDSRLTIIHRDLKASNILLDAKMNPKIADFGMARIFGIDQTQENTSKIVGTYGYMSPEYAMHGQFSMKSDVYSFGVLVLEIISGKKNSSFYQTDSANDLVTHAWRLWSNGTSLDLVDPIIVDNCQKSEVVRCIHIGLLCVQEDPVERPTMQTIFMMFTSNTVTLPVPREPRFFVRSRPENDPIDSDQSKTTKSVPTSVDDSSITDLYPR